MYFRSKLDLFKKENMQNADKEIKVVEGAVEEVLSHSIQVIQSEEDVEIASKVLSKINKVLKDAESLRKEITKPLLDSKKKIDDLFKNATQAASDEDRRLRKLVIDWRSEEARRIAKEEERRRKIQEAHAKQGHNVSAPVEMMKTEQTIGKSTAQKYWHFEVIDEAAVPCRYKVVDERKIRAAIQEGVREINGVKIELRERLSISTR